MIDYDSEDSYIKYFLTAYYEIETETNHKNIIHFSLTEIF